jgi:hypothetical protein
MGRKARYCAFHSMEGSGAQHRNSIICGVTLEDCLRDEDLCDKVHLLCPSFLQYGVSTPTQTKELKDIQERATKLGRRHDFTIRKLYHIHEQSEWNWKAANNKIRDSLKALENGHHHATNTNTGAASEDSEMKDLLNNIVHTTTVPDAVLEFWQTLIPSASAAQCAATALLHAAHRVPSLSAVNAVINGLNNSNSSNGNNHSASNANGAVSSASANSTPATSSSSSSPMTASSSANSVNGAQAFFQAQHATTPNAPPTLTEQQLHQSTQQLPQPQPSNAAHSDLVNSLTLPVSVSRTNSIARVPSFGLSRPSVSRTNSASAVFDFCKNSDAVNLFAPNSSNIIAQLGRTQ